MHLGFQPSQGGGLPINKAPGGESKNAASPRREKMPKTIIFSSAFEDGLLFWY